ncbi:putative inorganic phosphate cotransporter isoform X1 [Homarus americanus]|uniref:putative inorganic phosphate cotransporter isoform X1 n=1 Tax=Homarus americanus TaxID=6706 RepID=UPI001C441E8F|nr:putative inorganic phosphate cotransporter isoform X1 [Homarus americanus]
MKPPTLKEQGYLPSRYLVALMAFLGMVFNYMLRVNINLTIVAMVTNDNSTSPVQDVCHFKDDNDQTEDYDGEFDWDEWTQGLITGSFFWGYIWTQIPGGRLAEVLGARRVFGGAILSASIVTMFVPLAAKSSASTLIAVRILLGLSEGATFPSTHALLATWAPPYERSTLSTIIYAGSQAGTIIGFPLAATIIDSLGWEAVFYIQASLTLVWCAGWFLLVADTPDSDSRISKVERDYIYNSLGGSKEKKAPPVPWRSALTSLPFWAILVAGVGNNWGFYTLLTDLPLYMKQMLQKDIKSNAVLSGLPYLGMWIFSLVVSSVGDRLRQNDTLSTQTVRKTANTIAHVGPAICLLCLSLVECNRGATIALLFTAVTLQGGIYTGFMVNHVDIAPNFAGTLFGITNAAATIPGWVAPMTVGALTNNQQTFGQWRKVFFISAGIFVVDALFFLLYASGKEQEWNKVPEKSVKKDLKDAVVTGQKSPPGVNMLQEGTTDMLDSEAYSKYILNSNFRNSYQNKAFQSE